MAQQGTAPPLSSCPQYPGFRVAQYSPTPEIQTATINWSFKNVDENVKVEVWDVVDKGIRTKPGQPVRLRSDSGARATSMR